MRLANAGGIDEQEVNALGGCDILYDVARGYVNTAHTGFGVGQLGIE